MKTDPKIKCENCLYWMAGQCHRHPPTIVPWPTDNQHPIMYVPQTSWPNVHLDDWCGEYADAVR